MDMSKTCEAFFKCFGVCVCECMHVYILFVYVQGGLVDKYVIE